MSFTACVRCVCSIVLILQIKAFNPTAPHPPGNILIVNYIHGGSHWFVLKEMGQILETRGHEVTYILPKSDKMPSQGVKNGIRVSASNADGAIPFVKADGTISLPCEKFWKTRMSMFEFFYDYLLVPEIQCRAILDDDHARHVIQSSNFSLAIVDMLGNECVLALLHQLQIPTIGYHAPVGSQIQSIFENPTFIPIPFLGFSDRMTFVERIQNVIGYMATNLFMDFYNMNTYRFVKQRLPNSPYPSDIVDDLAMFFLQGNSYIDYARQLPPNFKQMGCIQCRSPNPLPDYLAAIMDSSGHEGVVIVSFGYTMIRQGEVPRHLLDIFIEVAKRVNQTILMNYPIDYPLHRRPSNFHIFTWLPIQDILGHPQTRVFVSHCGFSSALEALYHAIPVVAIPIYFEQVDLARRISDKGYGVVLDKFQLTSDSVSSAIEEVIHNSSYKETISEMSERMRNEPFSPREQVIYWSEYIMRYQNTDHLKSGGRFLNRFQRMGIDLLIVLILSALALVYARRLLWHYLPQTKEMITRRFSRACSASSAKLIHGLKLE